MGGSRGQFDFFFFQAEDGIRDADVTGVQTCALPISCRLYHPLTRAMWSSYQRATDVSRSLGTLAATIKGCSARARCVFLADSDCAHRRTASSGSPSPGLAPRDKISISARANVWPDRYDGRRRRSLFDIGRAPASPGGFASFAELATSGWLMICPTMAALSLLLAALPFVSACPLSC